MSSTSSRLAVEPTVTAFSLYFGGPRNGERMSERLDGQVTLVAGAASGIGEGIARRFVAEGGCCAVVDIRDEPGLGFARELGPEVTAYPHTEVAVEDDVAEPIDLAVERFGRLDCVINNAGILDAVGSRTDDLTAGYRLCLVGC
jgi:NAD(P)-dependent dehydrogenase (short-subunit alcohol dehydrogenase family)